MYAYKLIFDYIKRSSDQLIMYYSLLLFSHNVRSPDWVTTFLHFAFQAQFLIVRKIVFLDILCSKECYYIIGVIRFGLLKPTGYVMHQQFNIQQLHVLPTLYLCVLYLSGNKQRLVPLTA